MANEIWKDAVDFPGYQVSNHGRIRNATGRIMKLGDNGFGYFKFRRRIDGTFRSDYIHRMVAKAFIPNPENKPCINHKDCNPANNNADNLEWCTQAENTEYMARLGRNRRTDEWIEHLYDGFDRAGMLRPVIGISIKTGDAIVFSYLNQVRSAGFQPSCVCACCKGTNGVKQHKGYRWRYV